MRGSCNNSGITKAFLEPGKQDRLRNTIYFHCHLKFWDTCIHIFTLHTSLPVHVHYTVGIMTCGVKRHQAACILCKRVESSSILSQTSTVCMTNPAQPNQTFHRYQKKIKTFCRLISCQHHIINLLPYFPPVIQVQLTSMRIFAVFLHLYLQQ